MTNTQKKNVLLGQLVEGSTTINIMGYIVWWNLKSVNLNKEQFAGMLSASNLDTAYARDRNYRSTLARALKSMEETRIIRRVTEDKTNVIYQFTEERQIDKGLDASLEYLKEARIIIDKETYHMFDGDFNKAITCSNGPIRQRVIEAFNAEKDMYHSSDITRYIQKIFSDNADMISLRDQGSIYFVPAAYQSVVQSVAQLVGLIGGECSFEHMPVPNVASSQKMVGNALVSEITGIFGNMEDDIKKVNEGDKDVTENWVDYRLKKISEIKARIDSYADILHDKGVDFNGQFDRLVELVSSKRKLAIAR